jgi:hypothetical protein
MCHPFQTGSFRVIDACETYPSGIVHIMDNLEVTGRTLIYES